MGASLRRGLERLPPLSRSEVGIWDILFEPLKALKRASDGFSLAELFSAVPSRPEATGFTLSSTPLTLPPTWVRSADQQVTDTPSQAEITSPS